MPGRSGSAYPAVGGSGHGLRGDDRAQQHTLVHKEATLQQQPHNVHHHQQHPQLHRDEVILGQVRGHFI